jgi:competence protein ComEC
MERHLPREEWKETNQHPVLRWIIGTVIVSLAAQLGTLGISMYYFHQVSCYFLLTNLIVLPIAAILVPCGLGCVALGGSPIGIVLGYPTAFLAQVMNRSVEWIESLPGSTVEANVSLPMVGVYYGLLLGLMLFLPNKWQKTT